MKINDYKKELTVNGHQIKKVRISQYYRTKHGKSINDELILELIVALDGEYFAPDSTTSGVEYYAADVIHDGSDRRRRVYRIVWIFEGDLFEIIGVVNTYRRKSRKKEAL